MSSLNKVVLIGRVGGEPNVRFLPDGKAVAHFSLATSEAWNDKNTGHRQERVEWHNINLYDRLAEIAGQYIRKGGLVYIEGKIQSQKYTGKDGIERTAYNIVASELKMLGSRPNGDAQASEDPGNPPVSEASGNQSVSEASGNPPASEDQA